MRAGNRVASLATMLMMLAICAPCAASAQSAAPHRDTLHPLDSLATESARLTARYADRRAAIADGYRRLGTDFPGMGEHWLHPGALLAGHIDAARPTLLTYATIAGRPTLLALGFVVTTRGDSAAATTPGWPSAWHEHSGLFADESGARAPSADRSTSGTHVWVLHVWSALENPDGRYAPDNWTLPFARLGITPPPRVEHDVGRAFSLAVGGDEYLRGVLADAGLLRDGTAAAADSVIADARAVARHVAMGAEATRRVRDEDVIALRAAWTTMASGLRRVLGTAVDPYLAPSHAGHTEHARH